MLTKTKASNLHEPIKLVLVTMDTHLNSAANRAYEDLKKTIPGATLKIHSASEFAGNPEHLQSCKDDIASGDIVIATMLFLEDHYLPILDDLKARREHCDAMVCAMSAGDVTKLTKIGKLDMSQPASGLMAMLKKLRPSAKNKDGKSKASTAGAKQMKMLRVIPQMLRFVPGTAQDLRAYFLCLQYWLGGSQENMYNMMANLINRYASGSREALRKNAKALDPVEYPDSGVYHPRMKNR